MATACETVVLGGVRELPPRERASLGWRCVDGYGVTGAWGVSRAAFAGEGVGGGRLRDGDSDAAKTGASAVPRPSLSNRKWMVDIFSHPPRKTAFSSAELARWRPRCGAVLWLQRLCYATRLHAENWAVIDSTASVIDILSGRTLRNASLFASSASLSFRQRCLCRRASWVSFV